MRFLQIKECLRLCRAANISAVIWGHRGIGKSEVAYQLACDGDGKTMEHDGEEVKLPIGFIDFRCSQIEASDLRGLPDKVQGRTVFLPPADMPIGDRTAEDIFEELQGIEDPEERRIREAQLQPHYKQGILLLDEINRAQDDVLQSVFQLLLDRKIGQYILPAGWSIVICCNYMEGDYITNGFTDAALLDRMCHLHLVAGEETLDDWCRYMADHHNDHAASIVEFCASNTDYLVGQAEGQLGFQIQPSPRSWDRVARIEKLCDGNSFSPESRLEVIKGLVGQECALSYDRYSCPVKPRDILNNGVKKYKGKLEKLDRNQLMGVAWGLISLVRRKMEDEKVVKITLDFAELVLDSKKIDDKDVVVAFCRSLLCGDEDEGMQLVACITNRELAAQVVEFFDQGNTFLTALFKRKDLHEKLSNQGWGDVK